MWFNAYSGLTKLHVNACSGIAFVIFDNSRHLVMRPRTNEFAHLTGLGRMVHSFYLMVKQGLELPTHVNAGLFLISE